MWRHLSVDLYIFFYSYYMIIANPQKNYVDSKKYPPIELSQVWHMLEFIHRIFFCLLQYWKTTNCIYDVCMNIKVISDLSNYDLNIFLVAKSNYLIFFFTPPNWKIVKENFNKSIKFLFISKFTYFFSTNLSILTSIKC